jgi:microfibrillar-associated protein 1
MTEEERREWQRRNPKPLTSSKKKWKFMQEY